MQQAKSSVEQKLVLSGLSNVSDPGALEIIWPFVRVEPVRLEAGLAVIKIADSITETYSESSLIVMKKLLAISKDENLRKQAEEFIQKIEALDNKTHR
jgi:hypothetical protein